MRLIDLSHPIHAGMMTFPSHWHPSVEVVRMGRYEVEHRETRRLVLGTHAGTHVDAPSHLIPGGATIDQIPLDRFLGSASVLNLTPCAPLAEVGVAELEQALGGRAPQKRLLLRYDWSDRWGDPSFYTSYPFLSHKAAEWMVRQGVELLGMDTPSPDNPKEGYGTPDDSPNHKVLLGHGVVLVEYLRNLRAITMREVELCILPLNVRGGDGAPARCIAIEQSRGNGE